jgi:hypothetical protein
MGTQARITIQHTNGATETWFVSHDDALRVTAHLEVDFGPADESEGAG